MPSSKFVLVILLTTSLAVEATASEDQDIKLVEELVHRVFTHCDLYLVESSWGRVHAELFISKFLSRISEQLGISNGFFIFNIKASSPQMNSDSTNHKFAPQCAFVLTQLKSDGPIDTDISTELTKLLTPTYGATTRRDQDHYALLTTKSSMDSVLNLDFTRQLKFKLVIYNDELTAELEVLSVCFYCDNGQPQIVSLRSQTLKFLRLPKRRSDENRELIFEDYTKNAHGYELQVSAQVRLVFVYAIVKLGDRWHFRRGFGKDIVDGITSTYNYTYRVHPAIGNGGSGAILPNGTWVGSVRDIIDGRCDIGVAVALNYARYKLIGGNSFFYAWINFIMGKPKHIYSWQTVLWPFNVTLWLVMFCALLTVLMTFKLLPLREVSQHKPREAFRRHYPLFILASFFEQDFEYPTASPSRVLCGIWLFATVILTTAYRSKLVTQMTFPTMQTLPKTFQDLAHSDFHWGLESAAIGGAAHQHFRTSSNPTNRQINAQMSLERNSQRCFTQGIYKNFACITWSTQGEYILHRNFTDQFRRDPLTMSEDLSAIVGSGIAYKKRALFRANFDRLVDSIREMGMADRWKVMDYDRERQDHLKWTKEHPEEAIVVEDEGDVLTLKNLKGPFYILFTFSFLSFLCFVCEFFVAWRDSYYVPGKVVK